MNPRSRIVVSCLVIASFADVRAATPYSATVSEQAFTPLGSFASWTEAHAAMTTGSVARQHLLLKDRSMAGSTITEQYWVPTESLLHDPWYYLSKTSGPQNYVLPDEAAEVADYQADFMGSPSACSLGLTPSGDWAAATSGYCPGGPPSEVQERYYSAELWTRGSANAPCEITRDYRILCRARRSYCSDWTWPGQDWLCHGRATGTISYSAVVYGSKPKRVKAQCEDSGSDGCDAVSGDSGATTTDYGSVSGLSAKRSYSSARGQWTFSFESSLGKLTPLSYEDYSNPAIKSRPYATVSDACEEGWREIQAQLGYSSGAARMTDSGCIASVDGVPKWRIEIHAYTASSLTPEPERMEVRRPEGRELQFRKSDEGWTAVDGSVAMRLDQTESGYLLQLPGGRRETYDANGQLTAYSEGGHTYGVARADSQVVVSDEYGRHLTATYTDGHVTHIDLPDGASVDYTYDGAKLVRAGFSSGESEGYTYESKAGLTLLSSHLYNDVPYASWEYDDAGRATATQRAGGAGRTSYDRHDGYTIVTRPLGDVRVLWTTQVKNAARLSQIADLNGKVYEQRTYDDNGFLQSRTDALGHVTGYIHDATGRELSRTEALGTPEERTTTTTWDPVHSYLPATVTTPTVVKAYTYTPAGQPLTRTETDRATGKQRVTTYTYTETAEGRTVTIDGPRTDVSDMTQTRFDKAGNLVARINALGHTTTFRDHDANGRPQTIVDPNGLVTALRYDTRGRLRLRKAGTESTQFTYTPAGDLKTVTLPSGEKYTYIYDAARRLTDVKESTGNRIHYKLDAAGNRYEEQTFAADGTKTRHLHRVFNTLGQLAQILKNSGGVTAEYAYNDNGALSTTTDGRGYTTVDTYDALNRLQDVEDALHHHTVYAYRSDDRVTSITDPNGNATTYAYDGFGDLLTQRSPDTGLTQFPDHDEAGNLLTRIDAKGQTATYRYDALNRLTTATYSDGTITYTWDTAPNGIGRIGAIQDMSGSTTFGYDKHGRVTLKQQNVQGVILTTRYGYDAGRLATMTYPSGMVVTYKYSGERVTDILINGTPALTNIVYEPFGGPRRWTFANGRVYERKSNLDGYITSHTLGDTTRRLKYDAVWNITDFLDDGSVFGYDPLNRLKSAKGPDYNLRWDYDANGNRRHQYTPEGATVYEYVAGTNRLKEIDDGSLISMVSHDENGSRTGDGKHDYHYDPRNRILTVDNGTTATYTYNALGQRVLKRMAEEDLVFAYDEHGELLGEYTGAAARQETVWLGNLPVVTSQRSIPYYVHPDHLGAPRLVSDQNARIVWRWESGPFGTAAANEDADSDGVQFSFGLRFLGQSYDAETAMYYNYYRDYDPAVGRYIESDLIGMHGGANTYIYALGSPIRFVDKWGLNAEPVLQGANTVTGDWVERPRLVVDTYYAGVAVNGEIVRFSLEGSGHIRFKVGCTETDGCGNVLRTWEVSDEGNYHVSAKEMWSMSLDDYQEAQLSGVSVEQSLEYIIVDALQQELLKRDLSATSICLRQQ